MENQSKIKAMASKSIENRWKMKAIASKIDGKSVENSSDGQAINQRRTMKTNRKQ